MAPETTTPPSPSPRPTSSPLIILFLLLSLSLAAATAYLFYQNLKLQQQLTQLQTPSSQTTTPSTDPTANWKTHRDSAWNFSLKYPPHFSTLVTPGDLYLYHLDLQGQEKTYLSGIIIEVKNLTSLEEEVEYRRWTIIGHVAEKIDSETSVTVSNIESRRLDYTYGEKQFSIAIIPYQKLVYTLESESNLLDPILSTFKFLDSNNSNQNYTCPTSEYIDCMPIVDSSRSWQCHNDYLAWAQTNCPNFKGVTLY